MELIDRNGGYQPIQEQAKLIDDNFATTVISLRTRLTIVAINAGATLIEAPGENRAIRIVNVRAVAYGGAVGAVTTVDVKGVQSSLAKLVAFAQASLTQSAVLTAGGTGATVLADGASFIACDDNTAITVDITGSDITTATGIDFLIEYVVE